MGRPVGAILSQIPHPLVDWNVYPTITVVSGSSTDQAQALSEFNCQMDSYLAADLQQRALHIPLVRQSGEQFLMQCSGLMPLLQQAVVPFSAVLTPSPGGLSLSGDKVAVVIYADVIKRVCEARAKGNDLDRAAMATLVATTTPEPLKRELSFRLKGLPRSLQPTSPSQIAFLQSLLDPGKELLFGIGPTGTGKTHIAIAAALNLLAEERFKHVLVTRPHIVMEGEVLTPATRSELEYDDQFEFLEDILRDLIGYSAFRNLVDQHALELLPLGHMRGRTFNDTLLIVDEAQNMTIRKMRMVVTRIGRGSRMVVTGDPNHVDLWGDEPSGLAHLLSMVEGTGIAKVHRFAKGQVIRSPIVKRLEDLYAHNSVREGAMDP
jgi:phosphate starvation-inducible protein PhoH and related proteins